MSLLGLTQVVFNETTGKWEVVPWTQTKPPAEPVYKIPTDLENDPGKVRADVARKMTR